ncbi:MAG: Chromate resistance protein ChrB, partial [Chloroflexota bacterium]
MQAETASDGNVIAGHWLLFIYRLPTEPSSARTATWRETKRLGALSLQHGVCLLPRSEINRAAYGRLARRVAEYGGEATVLETRSPDESWQERTVSRFNAARDEEYEEVVDEAERFREEIARERRKGKFTFAELEDEESNLERLRKYLAQVEARDTLGAQGAARAAAEVEDCATVLDAFAKEIYERQN